MILTVIPEIGCHTLPHLQGVVGFICLPEEREKGKPDREGVTPHIENGTSCNILTKVINLVAFLIFRTLLD